MRVFTTKEFARLARKERIGANRLRETVARAERGLIDADLGGGLIKQRLARAGQGRSRGDRMLAAYRTGKRAVFLYGFAKSGKASLASGELVVYRQLAGVLLKADAAALARLLADGEIFEVAFDGENPIPE